MNQTALNLGKIATVLAVDFLFFSCVFLYLLYLVKIRFFPSSETSCYFTNVVNNFYLLLTATTFVFTLIYALIYPLYFSGGALILIMLALVFIYFFYLRATDTFKYLVLIQKIHVLPLMLYIMVTLFTLAFIFVDYCVQIQLVWGFSFVPPVGDLENPKFLVENQPSGETSDPVIGTPLEGKGPGPERPSSLWGKTCGIVERWAHRGIDRVIDSDQNPGSQTIKDFEKIALKDMTSVEPAHIWPLDSLGVDLGNCAMGVHPVQIQGDKGMEDAMACCYQAKSFHQALEHNLPRLLRGMSERLLLKTLSQEQGCFVFQRDSSGEMQIVPSPDDTQFSP